MGLLLFVCCLISAFCGTEGKEDRPLAEALANGILERDLREAGQDEKGRKKSSGRKSKKPKKRKSKAKNQKPGKKGRTGKNINLNNGRRRKVGKKNGGKRKGRKTDTM